MLGDDANGAVCLLAQSVGQPGAVGDEVDQGTEDVGFVDVVLALKDLDGPLQPHAGVDVLFWQQYVITFSVSVVLREDEVVKLEEIVADSGSPSRASNRGIDRRQVFHVA